MLIFLSLSFYPDLEASFDKLEEQKMGIIHGKGVYHPSCTTNLYLDDKTLLKEKLFTEEIAEMKQHNNTKGLRQQLLKSQVWEYNYDIAVYRASDFEVEKSFYKGFSK
ncbi:hypothetical protein BDF21DRAFT_397107 [Thamnidium elegans]|nr:hypothetical protein BDF21DRAFT_397107 [Thamnidium elegans]